MRLTKMVVSASYTEGTRDYRHENHWRDERNSAFFERNLRI